MKKVYILWEDCITLDSNTWVDMREWEYEPCFVHTVGFVLKETEECFILTDSYRMDGAATGPVTQIPKKMVVEWHEV